jgi:uncharacterized protein
VDRNAARVKVYAWQGVDAPRFEVALVDVRAGRLSTRGTQLAADYRLTYTLETGLDFVSERFDAACETAAGEATLELRRGSPPLADDVLDIDLGFSPLFNTLPVLRHRLHEGGTAREFLMAFVDVPSLDVSRSEQVYEPLVPGVVRYRSGSFAADIRFDAEGFVLDYPGLARRVEAATMSRA